MIVRLARSRAARKFFGNRLAVAALAVIGLYMAFGAYVLIADIAATVGQSTGWFDMTADRRLGAFTLDKAEEIVGPRSMRGWLERETGERRLEHCKFYLDEIGKAARQSDPGAALARIRLGERTPIEEPPDQFKARVAEVQALYDEVAESEDLDNDPGAIPRLGKLEAAVAGLFKPLSGFDRWMQALRTSMGTDRQGRSLAVRGLYSIKVAIQIGLVVSVTTVLLGTLIGAAAAFYGRWVDEAVVWLYSTLSSIPDLVLLAVLVFMFTGTVFDDVTRPWLSLVPVYTAMVMTFWIGPCRVVRGEVMKLKEMEYVQAATAVGFSRMYILLRHVVPNTAHLMFINFSLLFIAAVKFEVILSFLGLGVKVGPSWGRMIQESAAEVITGNFWQIGVATFLMFFLVLAFNILSDALQDAFDPKHVG